MLDRILLPTDGSMASMAVVPYVVELARSSGAEVVVVRVADVVASSLVNYPAAPVSKDVLLDAEDEARRDADDVWAALVAMGIRARAEVLSGGAAESILETARREAVGLIAIATHGRTGLARWALGSVTEKVVRASPMPVLVVRSVPEEPGTVHAVSRGSQRPFHHILVPTNGSDLSLGIVPMVSKLAKLCTSLVTVVHFVPESMGQAEMAAGRAYIVAACKALAAEGIGARAELRRGDAAAGIVDYGFGETDEPVDLIAMATHGRTGLPRWVFGSVTEKVMRHALVPTLAARTWLA